MSYKLEKPYTEEQRINFIVEYNHQKGLKIEEGKINLSIIEPMYTSYFEKEQQPVYALECNEIMNWVDFQEQVEIEVEPAVYQDIEVFDTQIIYTPVLDENGEHVLDEYGAPQYIETEEKILIPAKEYDIYEVDEEGMTIFDENGEPIVKEHVVVPEHYKSHIEQQLVKEAVYETQTIVVQRLVPVLNPNYETELAQKEHERIQELYMTRSDFFDGTIKAFGLDADELLTVVTPILLNLPIEDVDKKVALNNYKNALNFYRKHTLFTLLSNVPMQVTPDFAIIITEQQWDKFFDETNKKNPEAYKELIYINDENIL